MISLCSLCSAVANSLHTFENRYGSSHCKVNSRRINAASGSERGSRRELFTGPTLATARGTDVEPPVVFLDIAILVLEMRLGIFSSPKQTS